MPADSAGSHDGHQLRRLALSCYLPARAEFDSAWRVPARLRVRGPSCFLLRKQETGYCFVRGSKGSENRGEMRGLFIRLKPVLEGGLTEKFRKGAPGVPYLVVVNKLIARLPADIRVLTIRYSTNSENWSALLELLGRASLRGDMRGGGEAPVPSFRLVHIAAASPFACGVLVCISR